MKNLNNKQNVYLHYFFRHFKNAIFILFDSKQSLELNQGQDKISRPYNEATTNRNLSLMNSLELYPDRILLQQYATKSVKY
jgi:hypothetical protein